MAKAFITAMTNKYKIEGAWLNGEPNGYWREEVAGKVAIGIWKNGKLVNGTLFFSNGEIYEGSIVNGKKEGFGKFTSKSGSIFLGHFKNNMKHGKISEFIFNGIINEGNFIKNN